MNVTPVDPETGAEADRHPSQVCPLKFSSWDHGLDEIAGLESLEKLGFGSMTNWETEFSRAAALSGAVASGCDPEWANSFNREFEWG